MRHRLLTRSKQSTSGRIGNYATLPCLDVWRAARQHYRVTDYWKHPVVSGRDFVQSEFTYQSLQTGLP